jgi:hypothetical protein
MRYCTTHSTSAALRSPVTISVSRLVLSAAGLWNGSDAPGVGEAELLLQLPFDGNDRRRIDTQRQLEMQTRLERRLRYLPKRWTTATESLGTVYGLQLRWEVRGRRGAARSSAPRDARGASRIGGQ